jgi:serine/threonine protein kinase
MNTELSIIARLLENARQPEEVFGKLEGDQAEALRGAYRSLTKIAHPDRYRDAQDQALAEQAFRTLQKWTRTAEEKILCGTYGQAPSSDPAAAPALVQHGKHSYIVQAMPLAQGDMCNLYQCTHLYNGAESAAIFKVARKSVDNDLLANEAAILRALVTSPEYTEFHAYVPRLVDSFDYRDPASPRPRRVNVLAFEEGHYFSLQEVRAHYTDGIDPKDMAWMWRRLLIALGFAHTSGVIHGAVLPTHVLIQPEQHGLVLIDWSYALSHPEPGDYIPAIASDYQAWYPPEVLAKETPTPSTDLYMAALCMIYLLGGDPITGTLPASVPQRIQSFFRGVARKKPTQRPQNALALLDEFTDLIEQLWGPRTFRAFSIPTK